MKKHFVLKGDKAFKIILGYLKEKATPFFRNVCTLIYIYCRLYEFVTLSDTLLFQFALIFASTMCTAIYVQRNYPTHSYPPRYRKQYAPSRLQLNGQEYLMAKMKGK
ncbi:MAG: hypothetical protein ABIU30_09865 [Ferruginibacter sp.]